MRIAFFGGTFDPPHRAHLAVAGTAAEAFQLDSVLFAPVGLQPLKEGRATTPFADRLAMVELACTADPRFHASTIDAPLPDASPNYTVDTLATLRSQLPDAKLFSIVGADSFLTLRQWRQPDRLLALAEWIVVSRPGSPLDDLSSLHLSPAQKGQIHTVETMYDDLSATALRQRLAEGQSCDDLLPPPVADYIRQHGLYRKALA